MSEALFTRPGFSLGLRPISLDDVDAIMTWVNDPEVVRNFATMGQITREQEVAFLQKTMASQEDRLYAIVSADGRYIGNFGKETSVIVDYPFITGRSTPDSYLTGQKMVEVLEKGLTRFGW